MAGFLDSAIYEPWQTGLVCPCGGRLRPELRSYGWVPASPHGGGNCPSCGRRVLQMKAVQMRLVTIRVQLWKWLPFWRTERMWEERPFSQGRISKEKPS
ncbi:MAG: hypothetical protein AB1405_03645 [Bdellovibrionota bacterium]